jgi:hypothetical protein
VREWDTDFESGCRQRAASPRGMMYSPFIALGFERGVSPASGRAEHLAIECSASRDMGLQRHGHRHLCVTSHRSSVIGRSRRLSVSSRSSLITAIVTFQEADRVIRPLSKAVEIPFRLSSLNTRLRGATTNPQNAPWLHHTVYSRIRNRCPVPALLDSF